MGLTDADPYPHSNGDSAASSSLGHQAADPGAADPRAVAHDAAHTRAGQLVVLWLCLRFQTFF